MIEKNNNIEIKSIMFKAIFLTILLINYVTATQFSYYKFEDNILDSLDNYNGVSSTAYFNDNYPTYNVSYSGENKSAWFKINEDNKITLSSLFASNFNDDFSINGWIYMDSSDTDTNKVIFSINPDQNSNFLYFKVRGDHANELQLYIYDSSTNAYLYSNINTDDGSNSIPENTWTMITASFCESSDIITLYINGELVATGNQGNSLNTDFTGQNSYLGYGQDDFTGYIDEFSFYNEVLNDSEISSLYNCGKLECNSSSIENETIQNQIYNLTINSPQDNSINQSLSTEIKFEISNLLNDSLNITLLNFSNPTTAEDWTLIIEPDTQYLTESYNDRLISMREWVVENKEQYNIKGVVSVGDMVEHATSLTEWEFYSNATKILDDNNIMFVANIGNHDVGEWSTGDHSVEEYTTYFPVSRYENKTWWGGSENSQNKNLWVHFNTGNEEWAIMSLEFCPTNETLTWANSIMSMHQEYKWIVTNHAYLVESGDRRSNVNYDNYCRMSGGTEDGPYLNFGEDIWNKVIENNNVYYVYSGNFHANERLSEINNYGNNIWQIMSNYQNYDNGGDGRLRIHTFSPLNNTLAVNTYSPYLNSYTTGDDHEFNSYINLNSTILNSDILYSWENVSQNSNFTFIWDMLEMNRSYYWSVDVVSSKNNNFLTDIFTFKTLTELNDSTISEEQNQTQQNETLTELELDLKEFNKDLLKIAQYYEEFKNTSYEYSTLNNLTFNSYLETFYTYIID